MVFGMILNHEPWRDEAHGWTKAREYSVTTLITEAKEEGTPVLWFLIVKPLVKIGLPYISMNLLHGMLAITTVGLLLFFGKIPLPIKILFIVSYYMAYEYAVIARNYVLTALLVFLIAFFYRCRFEKPIIFGILVALLFQTNTLSLGPAIAVMLMFGMEIILRKKLQIRYIIALSIMAFTGIATIMMLYNPVKINNYPVISINYILNEIIAILSNLVFPRLPILTNYFYNSPALTIIGLTLAAVLFISFMVVIFRNLQILLMVVLSYGWLFYVNVIVHQGSFRHHGLALVYLIFFWWIFNVENTGLLRFQVVAKKIFTWAFGLILVILLHFTLYIYYQDETSNFSGAKDMAIYIKNHNLTTVKTVAYIGSYTEAILPYFMNKQFWYPEFKAIGFFNMSDAKYNRLVSNLAWPEVYSRIQHAYPNSESSLLLLSGPLPQTESSHYKLLHKSLAKPFWIDVPESFWLYEKIN
jgi:hypothetical protein